MTTIRADFSVATKSEVDEQWYFNVLAFEQQECCDLTTGTPPEERSAGVLASPVPPSVLHQES